MSFSNTGEMAPPGQRIIELYRRDWEIRRQRRELVPPVPLDAMAHTFLTNHNLAVSQVKLKRMDLCTNRWAGPSTTRTPLQKVTAKWMLI